jgi:hypothetical protein
MEGGESEPFEFKTSSAVECFILSPLPFLSPSESVTALSHIHFLDH